MRKLWRKLYSSILGTKIDKKIGLSRKLYRYIHLPYHLRAYKNTKNTFLTLHVRPKKSENITVVPMVKQKKTYALLMQGPLQIEEDFTYETVKLYRKLQPDAEIILSTWSTESQEMLRRIQQLGIITLVNELPAQPGVSNINYQLVSTKVGLQKAKELGYQYVLKSRADQRMYAPNLFDRLRSLQKSFPINSKKQKERILGGAIGMQKYKAYAFCDMLQFGHIHDMIRYWDAPLDTRTTVPPSDGTNLWAAKNKVAEAYVHIHYLQSLGRKILYTVNDSWQIYTQYFCVFDNELIDVYWPKYEHFREHRLRYYTPSVYEGMDFGFWLMLFQGAVQSEDVPKSR